MMDVVLLTSRMEGLPNVLLEAQSFGIPVVAPAVGGSVQLVTQASTSSQEATLSNNSATLSVVVNAPPAAVPPAAPPAPSTQDTNTGILPGQATGNRGLNPESVPPNQ